MTHTLLPTFNPSEAELVAQAMAQPLAVKIRQAIGLLQLHEGMAKSLAPDGYWLAYSGGKDSDVILELAQMAGVQYRPVYNVTTIDAPELVRYIKREHPEVEFNRPEKALLTMLAEDKSNGPPTRRARWCCEVYKEQGGLGTAQVTGVRAAESTRRAAMWKQVTPHRKTGVIICPIVYWTDADVWEFHRQMGIPHCELYDEGFTRLGCIGCPMAGPAGQIKEFARWPRYEKLWQRAFDRYWQRWHGVPTLKGKRRWFEDFGSAEELWKWWRSGKRQGKVTGCQMEFLFT